MKNIILKIVMIGSCFMVASTNSYSEELFTGNLTKYTGIWSWKDGNKEFKIILKVGREELRKSSYFCLLGGYFYRIGNETIDYQIVSHEVSRRNNWGEIPIVAVNAVKLVSRLNEDRLTLFFQDYKYKKSISNGVITYLSPTTIRWQLFEDEGDYSDELPQSGFSVPVDVILTKIQ